jgi:protein-S-isoprenylcysteine O-methyltransferase Ste14
VTSSDDIATVYLEKPRFLYVKEHRVKMIEHFEKAGNWLFARRSYLPIVCIGVILLALRNYKYPYASHTLDQLWEALCLVISLLGLAVRIATVGHTPKGTSGRNSKQQKAEVLNTTGMYSIVRHPLYLGNFLIWLGISLFPRFWWLSVILLLAFWLYYERIIFAEEQFLQRRFGKEFNDWAGKTPAFIPRFSSWKRPVLPFSLRTVFKREHSTLLLIVVYFASMEEAASLLTTGSLELDMMWLVVFTVALAQYMFFRTLKKHTKLLNVPGL